MVNVSGLQRRSTYEEVAKAAELDEFRNLIKTPDRLPKTIIDAPSMTALDPENEEALIQFEKNKRQKIDFYRLREGSRSFSCIIP